MTNLQALGIIASILFGFVGSVFLALNFIKGLLDNEKKKIDSLDAERESLRQSNYAAQITNLTGKIDTNHQQALLIFDQLKESIRERKEVSQEKATLIHILEGRLGKLEGRVDKVEGVMDDIKEIKEMVKEISGETKELIKENKEEVKAFSDEIGKIKISLFNAGIK